MPRNGFAFPVRVGCKVNLVCRFCLLADFLDHIASAADVDVMRLKAVLNIHAERALGQIADMPDAGNDFII